MRGWGALLCALWCLAACGVVALRVSGGQAFDTDLQSLLPRTALDPVIRAAITDAGGAAAQRVTVLVSHENPFRAQDAATDLQAALESTDVYRTDAADGAALGRWLFANRNTLMCEADPERFDSEAVMRGARTLIYAPIAPVSGEMLVRDPFLLTLQLAQCLAPVSSAGDATLVSGALEASAFRIDAQDKISAAFDAWRARWPDVTVARAGAVFYAEDAAHKARQEISLIAGTSTIAIVLLLLVCFRRPQAIIGTLTATAVSAVASLAAALLVFPSVHVLVFVFGSALIGVTSDYALHYLATGPQTRWAPPRERVRLVARPLAVCALSTSIGFASLGLFGVSIFDQVAVFSVAGVLTAWWFTLTLLPLMDRTAKNVEQRVAWWARLEAPFRRFRWARAHSVLAVIVLLGALIGGVARFTVMDDVRQFQPRSPVLTAEEEQVRAALGFSASPVFLLSHGANSDAARVAEETALAALPAEAARDVIAVSRLDPSDARRAQNEAVLRTRLYEPHLQAWRGELGLSQSDASDDDPVPRPSMLADLEGVVGETSYLVAPLGALAAQTITSSDDAIVVDPAARYSQAFERFRHLAGWAVALAFGVCALVVVLLYRTPRALVVLAAPALGVLMALAVPIALGAPVTFFSVAALFIVIGTGIDHSVFMYEAASTDGQSKELVVFLAVVTTILSMGLMGFSSSLPVQGFGMAVAAGVTAAYLYSFVPARIRGRAAGGND